MKGLCIYTENNFVNDQKLIVGSKGDKNRSINCGETIKKLDLASILQQILIVFVYARL